jgi:hypothetical protein
VKSLTVFGLLPTPTTAPSAPANLNTQAVSPYAIDLNWANTATNQAGVEIEASTDGKNFTQVATLSGYPTEFTATGLQPDTNYTFRIIAQNTIGTSKPSNLATGSTEAGVGGSILNFSTGFNGSSGVLDLNSPAKVQGQTLLLTNGTTGQTSSAFSKTALKIQSFYTTFSFSLASPEENGFVFAIENTAPTAVGSGAAGLGYAGIKSSVGLKFDVFSDAGEGNDSTGL